MNIGLLTQRFDVAPLAAQLASHPEQWDLLPWRTEDDLSPHREASDIWVRYNALENLGPDFNEAHDSVWYPVCKKIPAARELAEEVAATFDALKLGGVLITKVPAHARVYPHVDLGWHATHYEKIAVQIASSEDQGFYFEGEHVCAEPGECYWFINQARHWVINESDHDRITLIVCIRRVR